METETRAETEPEDTTAEEIAGQQFGPYTTLRLLGKGGMGAVYLAEQQKPIRRLVALKLIKAGMDTREVIARFESERQALALMDHPNIARVIDAGSGNDGRPYFVMEYVPGIPITEYCDRQRLTNRERLELFLPVCQALQHAHQKGIIHRDIKPSNVLVSMRDGIAVPKVIDFGVAKAIKKNLIEQTLFTEYGVLIGTPEYMSPEQAEPTGLDVDTTSDVYSLGILLYELLVGVPPFDLKELRKKGLVEILRVIREEDRKPLTSRLRTLGSTSEIAKLRDTNPRTLLRQLTGELDWITMRAMEKDRRRRYNSAAEFASDIQHYLNNEPVVAGRPSRVYRIRKFVSKHRWPVAAAAALVGVLTAGIVASTLQAAQARQERDHATAAELRATQARDQATAAEHATASERDRAVQAEQIARDQQTRALAAEAQARQDRDKAVAAQQRADTEAAKTKGLNDFLLKDLLQLANPMTQAQVPNPLEQPQSGQPNQRTASINPNLSVREALDRAAAGVEGKFDKQPLVEAAIRETIADIYDGMHLSPPAIKQMERVVALRTAAQGKDHRDTLQSRNRYASLLVKQGQYMQAEAVLKGIIEDGRHGLGEDNPVTRNAVTMLVTNYVNNHMFAKAEAFLKSDVIPYDRRVLGEDTPTTLSGIFRLVSVYAFDRWQPPRFAEAETFLKGLMAEQIRKLGPKNHGVLTSMGFLARVYVPQNRYKDIIDLLEPAVRDESVPDVVKGGRASLEQHSYLPAMIGMLAAAYSNLGNSARAEALMREQTKLLDIRLSTPLGAESLEAPLISMAQMLANSIYTRRDAVANELLPRVLENFRRLAAQRDSSTVTARDLLFTAARRYVLRGKSRQGIQLLRDTIEILRSARGDEDPDTLTAIQAIPMPIYMDDDPGDVFEDAERFLGDIADIQRRVLGTDSIETWRTVQRLSDAYWDHGKSDQAQGRSDAAQRNYEEAEQFTRQRLDFFATQRAGASGISGGVASGVQMTRLAAIRASRGKYEEAQEAYKTDLGWTRRRSDGESGVEIFILLVTRGLGWTQLHAQKYAEAEATLREACIGLANPKNGFSESRQRYACESELGASLVGQKKYAEAEPLLRNGYNGLVRTQRVLDLMYAAHIEPRMTAVEAAGWIARMYEEWGKPPQAAEWRQRAETAR